MQLKTLSLGANPFTAGTQKEDTQESRSSGVLHSVNSTLLLEKPTP
jgi:hypothetical protein